MIQLSVDAYPIYEPEKMILLRLVRTGQHKQKPHTNKYLCVAEKNKHVSDSLFFNPL
jgi:hypothetical protein